MTSRSNVLRFMLVLLFILAEGCFTINEAWADDPTPPLALFTDSESLVQQTWEGNGSLTLSTSGGYEGDEHYVFDYTLSNWWAGFGLEFTGWAGNGTGYDFRGYETLEIACSLTGPAVLRLVMVDADMATATAEVEVAGVTGDYQLFSIPLSAFSGMTLDDVGQIQVNAAGTAASGSGTVRIDQLRLIDPVAQDTEAPTVPQDLTATVVGATRVNLDWTAATDNIGVAAYNIYRDGSRIASTERSCFSNAGLTPETVYAYRVSAVDAAGNESVQSPSVDAVTPVDPHPGGNQGWLTTQGNKIYKADGTVFAGRGANIFDTRLNTGGSYQPPSVAEVNRRTDEIVDIWGADYLRLVLESFATLDSYQVHGLSVLEDPAYLEDIVEIVEHIGTKKGVYVLVSIWNDPSLDGMGWPTEQTAAEWRVLVNALAQYPYVLFGVCNEPQSNYNGSLDAQVWARMTMVAEAIRQEEALLGSPKHIIAVQGTRGWARDISYYVDHPITAGGGENIVYETHVYNPEADFNAQFVIPSQTLPVVIGEFGPDGTYMNMSDCQALMDLAESLKIPYTGWSFNHDANPSMLVYQGAGNHIGIDLVPTPWGLLIKNQLAPIPGDADLDRDVDLIDAVRVLQAMSGTDEADAHFEGDADEDLKIGATEVFYILQKVVGLRD